MDGPGCACAHALLCGEAQEWYEQLVGEVEEVINHKEFPKSEEPAIQTTNVFNVEAKALHYVRVHSIYRSDPRVNQLQNISVVEGAIHFLRLGLPASKILEWVNYMGAQDAVSAHGGFTNVVINVLRISVDEVAFWDELSGNTRRGMARD